MAKSYSVGDLTYYHRVRVKVVEVKGDRITIEGLENKTRNGVDLGRPYRWTLSADELEIYE